MIVRHAWPSVTRRGLAVLAAAVVGAGATAFITTAAAAHGGDDSDRASVLVLQAIGLIVNKPGDMDPIRDKVNDAVDAPVKDGVDQAGVRSAQRALEKGEMAQVRTLLQRSLLQQPMQPARGEDTGTAAVHNPLNPRRHVAGVDGIVLAVSFMLVGLGVVLALRYRPRLGVRQLKRELASSQPAGP